jgi:VWFA-related protein
MKGLFFSVALLAATGLFASTAAQTQAATPTVRTTTRLVELGLVAYDKHGHQVTTLEPADFEVYDNDRKQHLKFFAAPNGSQTLDLISGTKQIDQGPDQPPATANSGSQTRDVPESSATVLLLDSTNLAWNDLSFARQDTLKFLNRLPDRDRIGLYIMARDRIKILSEPTANHAQVASLLGNWMPSAQDLAQAQASDRRIRQQFDTVRTTNDLANVNGNAHSAQELFAPVNQSNQGTVDVPMPRGLDPQLRENALDPEQGAFMLFAIAAQHLSSIPGHKNLVWITSNNVLVDTKNRPDASSTTRPGNQLALQAEEALNDAHVSLYPMDASKLDAGGIGADLENRNVEAVGYTSRSGEDTNQGSGLNPGRETAQAQQNLLPISGVYRAAAEGTGGRIFRRSSDISSELDTVVADSRAFYLLSFAPDVSADGKYHDLVVRLARRHDLTLRYRTGYFYDR